MQQGEALQFSSLISINVHVTIHELAVPALTDLNLDLHPQLAHDDALADSLKADPGEHLVQATVALG